MSEKRAKDDEVDSSAPPPFKKLKTTENGSSMYDPEPVKPEWLELPPELEHYSKSSSDAPPPSAAWNKYYPYDKSRQLPLTPLNHPPTFTPESPALCFQVHGICGRARACTLHFPNGGPPVPTPRFMPVGTKGTLKGVLPREITEMNCPIILANTYHLAIQPGTDLIDEVFGGLPKFMGSILSTDNNGDDDDDDESKKSSTPPKRRFNLLTDSGGFQMVSLAALSQVTEKGVLFESPYTGKPMLLKPEDSIRCQNQIGADIIMQLDDVVSSVATDDNRFKIATFRTLRWYDRCVEAHEFPSKQNLFPIMQGALDTSQGGLRELCLAGFKHRDEQAQKHKGEGTSTSKLQQRIPGFAIGGLAGGESKDDFWKVVDHACRHLPDDRPRYLMGVGYPLDLVVCTALGVDQYDCVYPTRTARFGVALSDAGLLKLKQHEFVFDNGVVEKGCPCQACTRGVSRKRLHMLLKSGNTSVAIQLLTLHNVCYMMGLVNRMRQAILDHRYPDFCRQFLAAHFPNQKDIPSWVVNALGAAGIAIDTTSSGTSASAHSDFINSVEEIRKNTSFDATEKENLRDELKREWDAAFQELDEIQANVNREKLDKWFDRLYQQHNEEGRYYHTAVHLMEMSRYWNAVVAHDLSLSAHSPAICLATFFHDAIYDPKSSTNEEDSDKLFKEFCSDIQLVSDDSSKDDLAATVPNLVSTMILATKKHEIITNETTPAIERNLQKIFLDIDMSVLGKHENAYLAYAGCIRKEYSFVEKPMYCEKRADILTGFLENKKQIFLSDLFHETSEAQARSNLKREIELLKKGSMPGGN